MDFEERDIHAFHKGREVIYAFFSRLFLYPPSQSIYGELNSLRSFFESIAQDTQSAPMQQCAKALEKFINQRNSLENQALKEFDLSVLRDYTRLFCLSDSVAVSQSVYVSPDHLTMDKSASETAEIYSRNGFAMNSPSREPSDHISYELMFLASLAAETAEACNKKDFDTVFRLTDESSRFIGNYPQKWFGLFYNTLGAFSQSESLYAPAAGFILCYIDEDKRVIDDMLEGLKNG